MSVQRYKVGYYKDEWGMSSNTPCLLKDDNGYAVKFDDYALLKKQRDELLAALEDFSAYVHSEQSATDGAVQYSNTQINRLVFKARAAIASVKGEQ